MLSVIDSLKRLERIGDERGATVGKLTESARELSAHLVKYLPKGDGGGDYIELPRRYWLRGDGSLWAEMPSRSEPAVRLDNPDRDTALGLARDIATGWIGELADWLQEHQVQDEQAIAMLRAASTAPASAGTVTSEGG